MRTIVSIVVVAMALLGPNFTLAEHAHAAQIGQVQPTILGVRQAQAAKGERSPAEIQIDQEIEKAEEELRNKLIICRGC